MTLSGAGSTDPNGTITDYQLTVEGNTYSGCSVTIYAGWCAHPASFVWTDVPWIWLGNDATIGRLADENTLSSRSSFAT